MFTLELARAHIRELHRAAERSHRNALTPVATSRLRRFTDRATGHR